MVQKKPLTPFFTIITCTRNSAIYLPKCLKSVNYQTFRDFEHIIIDGYSTDQTLKILKNNHLKPVSLAPTGIASAMNEGIRRARGKYVFFLNSDDSFATPHVLLCVHEFLLDHPGLDWIYGQIKEVNQITSNTSIFPTTNIFKSVHPILLWIYNYIPHQSVFIKKDVFKKFGLFNPTYQICMDYEYWLRISRFTSTNFIPTPVANYLVHDLAMSSKTTSQYRAIFERLRLRMSHPFGLI